MNVNIYIYIYVYINISLSLYVYIDIYIYILSDKLASITHVVPLAVLFAHQVLDAESAIYANYTGPPMIMMMNIWETLSWKQRSEHG